MIYIILFMIGFLSMYIDKKRAVYHQRRIKETHLLLIAAFSGCLGSLLGMYICHHKTNKPKFYIGIPCILLLEIIFYFKLF